MKSRFNRNTKVGRQQIEDHIKNYLRDRYADVAVEVSVQMVAVVMCVLDKHYGWKKKRLEKFFDALMDQTELMCFGNIFNQKLTTWACVDYIKDKYGINLQDVLEEIQGPAEKEESKVG